MFLGLTFAGYSFFTSLNPTLGQPVLYNKATICGGNTGCIVANIWGRNKLLTEEEISIYDIVNYKPAWDADTYSLASFKYNLNIGNITGLENPMTHWTIARKAIDESVSRDMAEISVSNTRYEDFLPLANKTYEYYIYAKNEEEISSPVIAQITPEHYGWFLIDIEKGVVYKFNANVESGSLTYDEDIVEYKNNTQYPVFSKGKTNSATVQINAVIFDPMSCDNPYSYKQSNEILDSLNEFIKSSRPKILKDRRGRIWRGEAFANSESQLNDGIAEQIVSVSFTFKETDKV